MLSGNHSKKFLWARILALSSLALVTSLSLFIWLHRSSRVPSAQADGYVKTVMPDFQELINQLHYYESGFAESTEKTNQAKEAYYEISSTRDYFSAVEDTRQDIQAIETTLKAIDQAVADKKMSPAPTELAELDANLNLYYQSAVTGLKQLLIHEKFQLEMLNASGDELNQKLDRFGKLVGQAGSQGLAGSELIEFLDLINSIGLLGEAAVLKFDQIDSIPIDETRYYGFQKATHQDIALTFQKLFRQLKNKPQAGWPLVLATNLSDYAQRNQLRQKDREADTLAWMEATQIKISFAQTTKLEPIIADQIKEFLEKYDLVN